MDIVLQTSEVWQFKFEFEPRSFLAAASLLLNNGDVAIFGAYEPTAVLVSALEKIGAVSRSHIPEFLTCFDVNRSEHPNGCAFELTIRDSGLTDLLKVDAAILKQKDIPSFFDHFIAFTPGPLQRPLISFHDAACGGTLYVSGHYSQELVIEVARRLGGTVRPAKNLYPQQEA